MKFINLNGDKVTVTACACALAGFGTEFKVEHEAAHETQFEARQDSLSYTDDLSTDTSLLHVHARTQCSHLHW
ncbi:hypothetical protein [Undibacterium pigrum]|uniref:Uncharacterized protein n=1 Tax=Undibacterium pigrum TaxID=401470 RepID=A0A318JBS0_9BURK|nr:hypothetical protein [Undibacterium pigrum]PXX37902.1 hypothetical protein DFR42_11461 [Undibacterium pigrum]